MEFFNKILLLFLLIINMLSCQNSGREIKDVPVEEEINVKSEKIRKVCFYIENSESMFGYIKNYSEYIEALSELSEKPRFVVEETPMAFYFINGAAPTQINSIGNDSKIFKQNLKESSYRCGDITKSDLNDMFLIALNKAQNDTISILISDGIYDIVNTEAPFNILAKEGKETRSQFLKRLQKDGVQTLMIKIISEFNGKYFFVSKKGSLQINQKRPFYIWIFGKSDLLNDYFTEDYIRKMQGYANYSRFLPVEDMRVTYQVITENAENRKGSFKFDKTNKNKLVDVKSDRNGQGFQFSFVVDFSDIPFSENYVTDTRNYSTDSKYQVVSVKPVTDKIHSVPFEPTHIITIFTDKSPAGKLSVSLDNRLDTWMATSNADSENEIDTSTTFGLKFLSEGIIGAYEYKNGGKKITTFNFELQ